VPALDENGRYVVSLWRKGMWSAVKVPDDAHHKRQYLYIGGKAKVEKSFTDSLV
jgi:hypothetical protein